LAVLNLNGVEIAGCVRLRLEVEGQLILHHDLAREQVKTVLTVHSQRKHREIGELRENDLVQR
jgi:hypothetical protein